MMMMMMTEILSTTENKANRKPGLK